MKTVSARIVSSKPISLSRAAKFLSNFVECDNGASRAISTYLRHSYDAFNELSEFHKKLKSSCSDRKSNRSYASSGISNFQIEHSSLSAQSSEGGKRKGKNRKDEADIGVNRSESVPRNSHGGDSENGFVENLANSVEDNSEAVTDNKKRKKKHAQKDRDDESAENGGNAREKDAEGVSKSLGEGVGDDSSEMSIEKKGMNKKKKEIKGGEEDDVGMRPNDAGKKEASEEKYEGNVSTELEKEAAVELPESGTKKRKRKKKGDGGRYSLPWNGVSKGEGEVSEAKSGSEDGKNEKRKKRKIEEAAVCSEVVNGSTGHRNKKAKIRMAD
ncbi:hypothetical protein MLD38_013801 [Melastoma candidum]|uniref:Uncharacterized protein n=1 Tax=Melastoma candidum TaxID=119954 RepID=A0ACB9RAT4_9MYRT|nr:hypothetical protein MLD38_013801 [Melastoma candidum]